MKNLSKLTPATTEELENPTYQWHIPADITVGAPTEDPPTASRRLNADQILALLTTVPAIILAEITSQVNALVGAAPGTLDTLQEIAAALDNNDNAYNTLVAMIGGIDTGLSAHLSDTGNPHGVTKEHVGLSDVDNTSDAAKPVSTAQQTALNLKMAHGEYTFAYTMVNSASTNPGAGTFVRNGTGANSNFDIYISTVSNNLFGTRRTSEAHIVFNLRPNDRFVTVNPNGVYAAYKITAIENVSGGRKLTVSNYDFGVGGQTFIPGGLYTFHFIPTHPYLDLPTDNPHRTPFSISEWFYGRDEDVVLSGVRDVGNVYSIGQQNFWLTNVTIEAYPDTGYMNEVTSKVDLYIELLGLKTGGGSHALDAQTVSLLPGTNGYGQSLLRWDLNSLLGLGYYLPATGIRPKITVSDLVWDSAFGYGTAPKGLKVTWMGYVQEPRSL